MEIKWVSFYEARRAVLGLHVLCLPVRAPPCSGAGGLCWRKAVPPPAPAKGGLSGLCEWPGLARCCCSPHLLGRLSIGQEEEVARQEGEGEEEEEEEVNKCFL